jgi:hypothetical protein
MSRGRAQRTLDLVAASYEILTDIHPATVRAVCYKLFVARLIASMAKSETNKISRLLRIARERGEIPWDWIVDETREAERVSSWDSPEDFAKTVVSAYRRDYWSQQRCRLEVWSEKGTVRGTLAPVLEEYGVTFRVMHGYSSATAIWQIAQETADETRIALYVGDWDPSGLHMSEVDLVRRLGDYGAGIILIRIALSEDDTKSGLPQFNAEEKPSDPRHQWFVRKYGQRCFELDALDPPASCAIASSGLSVPRSILKRGIAARAWKRRSINPLSRSCKVGARRRRHHERARSGSRICRARLSRLSGRRQKHPAGQMAPSRHDRPARPGKLVEALAARGNRLAYRRN